MTSQQTNDEVKVLQAQMKALLEKSPKTIDQSVFLHADDDVVGAYITSTGEARLTACPSEECQLDGDSWTTPLEYGCGQSLGFGYDPRGWQDSYVNRSKKRSRLQAMFPAQFNTYKVPVAPSY